MLNMVAEYILELGSFSRRFFDHYRVYVSAARNIVYVDKKNCTTCSRHGLSDEAARLIARIQEITRCLSDENIRLMAAISED